MQCKSQTKSHFGQRRNKTNKEKKIGVGSGGKKSPGEEIEGKIKSEPKRRGRPKTKDSTSKEKKINEISCPEVADVFRETKRGRKKKKKKMKVLQLLPGKGVDPKKKNR